MEFSEIEVLATCALRIDGYAWATDQGIEREQLMKPFWHPERLDELLATPWDYQWAAWFMQQRAFHWSDSPPSDVAIALWRRLFLVLADKSPSPPFDRGLDGDSMFPRAWESRFAPYVAALKAAIADRLARGVPYTDPIVIEGAGQVTCRRV